MTSAYGSPEFALFTCSLMVLLVAISHHRVPIDQSGTSKRSHDVGLVGRADRRTILSDVHHRKQLRLLVTAKFSTSHKIPHKERQDCLTSCSLPKLCHKHCVTTTSYHEGKKTAKSGDQAVKAVLLVTVNATEYPICSRCRANPFFVGIRPSCQPADPSTEVGESGGWRLQTTTTATTLSAGRVGGSGGNVLDTADLHAGTGQSTESGLGTGAGGLGAVTCGILSVLKFGTSRAVGSLLTYLQWRGS